jgi:hypothetical protein
MGEKTAQGTAIAPTKQAESGKSLRGRITGFVVFLAAIAGLLIYSRPKQDTLGYAPSITLAPMTERIVSGPFTVPAGRHVDFRFNIDPASMRNAHVVGHFLCTGGMGNDIVVVLAEEREFGKWIDGHVANVYYTTGGKVTTGSLDAQIRQQGTYYLSFSNTFSALSAKAIAADIDLKYSKATIR